MAAACLLPTLAAGHIERASYWPDPAPDNSVSPPAGGKVPAYRGLFTALDQAPPGQTRVVCQGSVPVRPTQQLRRARRALEGAERRRAIKRIRAAHRRRVNSNSSIKRLRRATKAARANGFIKYRPHGDRIAFGARRARRLLAFNSRLLDACRFHSIQDAVNASHNNDRVVVMPGLYTEPRSRAAPTDDPRCDGLEEQNDRGQTGGATPTSTSPPARTTSS